MLLDGVRLPLLYGLVDTAEVLALVRDKPAGLERVLPGRSMPDEILQAADLVTEMREVKHYHARGVPARRGIEY